MTKEHIAEHTPEAISARLGQSPDQSYLKDSIYGAIDGAVTTFAVVSGVAGANLSFGIVIVLGLANLVGDGFSMAASNYLGSRAERQLVEKARRTEERHIELYPEGEREEVRQLLMARGFEGKLLEETLELTTSDQKRWVDMMLQDELGLALDGPAPLRAAVVTFVAFIVVGALPLLAFVPTLFGWEDLSHPFFWSAVLTALAFFAVGAAKSLVVEQKWYWAGLETLAVGGTAASIAYAIGYLLRGVA